MYITIEDLKKMLPTSILTRLSDDESSGEIGDTQEARLQEGIDTGAAEIDTYIGGRLVLPLEQPFPAMIIKISEDISIYNIYSRLKEELPSTRQVRYDNALKWLKLFMNGLVSLPEMENTGRQVIQTDTREQVFTTDFLDKF